ncbi:hypothetical protein HK101_011789 [Irineochytrium annulatum]|nr:hypothetical protein HK101_011789 [Irineochytrium annulatum]
MLSSPTPPPVQPDLPDDLWIEVLTHLADSKSIQPIAVYARTSRQALSLSLTNQIWFHAYRAFFPSITASTKYRLPSAREPACDWRGKLRQSLIAVDSWRRYGDEIRLLRESGRRATGAGANGFGAGSIAEAEEPLIIRVHDGSEEAAAAMVGAMESLSISDQPVAEPPPPGPVPLLPADHRTYTRRFTDDAIRAHLMEILEQDECFEDDVEVNLVDNRPPGRLSMSLSTWFSDRSFDVGEPRSKLIGCLVDVRRGRAFQSSHMLTLDFDTREFVHHVVWGGAGVAAEFVELDEMNNSLVAVEVTQQDESHQPVTNTLAFYDLAETAAAGSGTTAIARVPLPQDHIPVRVVAHPTLHTRSDHASRPLHHLAVGLLTSGSAFLSHVDLTSAPDNVHVTTLRVGDDVQAVAVCHPYHPHLVMTEHATGTRGAARVVLWDAATGAAVLSVACEGRRSLSLGAFADEPDDRTAPGALAWQAPRSLLLVNRVGVMGSGPRRCNFAVWDLGAALEGIGWIGRRRGPVKTGAGMWDCPVASPLIKELECSEDDRYGYYVLLPNIYVVSSNYQIHVYLLETGELLADVPCGIRGSVERGPKNQFVMFTNKLVAEVWDPVLNRDLLLGRPEGGGVRAVGRSPPEGAGIDSDGPGSNVDFVE